MKSRPCSPARWAAFTLVELLTVIAIIGILAAIIIPTVGKVRESARSAQCISNLRQIHAAIHLYAADRKDQLPGPTYGVQSPYYSDSATNLARRLADYLPSRETGAGERISDLFACPSWMAAGGSGRPNKASYTLNNLPWPPSEYPGGDLDLRPFGDMNFPANPKRYNPRRLTELASYPLSQTWLMVDVDTQFLESWSGTPPGWKNDILPMPAHKSSHNVLFYDGHVRKTPWGQFRQYP